MAVLYHIMPPTGAGAVDKASFSIIGKLTFSPFDTMNRGESDVAILHLLLKSS